MTVGIELQRKPNISSDIELARLGDHVEILSGFAFDSSRFASEGEMPLVRIRDVVRGRTETYYSGPFEERFVVRKGDLLVGMDGDFNRESWSSEPALLNQRVCRISPDDAHLDRRYLYHFLPQALMEIWHATPFATVKHLSIKAIREIALPLPPLEEQRRIAAILDKADELRTKRRQALVHMDELVHSAFRAKFGDVVRNTRGWQYETFEDVAPSRLGKMLDKNAQSGNHLRKYLRNANVQWFNIETSDLAQMDFDEKSRSTFHLAYGDVLICEGGEPGRAAIWRAEIEDCYFQKAVHRARPNTAMATPEYIVYLLWNLSKGGGLADHVTAATIAHLTGEKLKRMKVPVPPLQLQKDFAAEAAAAERLKEYHRAHLRELDALFDSLQHRAFKGEL
ncbi:restriction endonuclease subunit S [Arthrobacter zhaoxinii]|uniref:restriction endonuclease subunit S n=1 Tax=Arthrobacter zhaoxinii TaxID=2964616 RepID=UPI0021078997|nr:restriction endonuclease subunit S [Arthrobacter zhaoxinii]MCQ2000556.1 restriction endonuclease subunit S [Arthrobacter zhaoxinii]